MFLAVPYNTLWQVWN
jgi:hypothetical protein